MSYKRLGISLTLAVAAALAAPTAQAIFLNTEAFRAAGGDPDNIGATVEHGMRASYQRSLQAPFDAVGHIPGCTGTWIGNDERHAWVLTAAHCVGAGWRNYWISMPNVGASGLSRVYWPPNRTTGTTTDVALVSIPLQLPVAPQWQATTKPLLYDGDAEIGRTVHLVGYGTTGLGQSYVWMPYPRLWGTSRITGAFAGGAALVAGYIGHGQTDLQTRAHNGDSGSALWQQHAGYWTAIGVVSTKGTGGTNATRINRHIDWIKGVFPGASTFSERFTVTATRPFVSRNHNEDVDQGTVYYVVAPNQSHVQGPTNGFWGGHRAHTSITVTATDAVTGMERPIVLRAWRFNGCRDLRMEDATLCHNARIGILRVAYVAEDNVGLPGGEWKAKVDVDAVGWHRTHKERFTIQFDVRNLVEGKVSRDTSWQSPNFASAASRGTVYYVVPPQAGASGPTSRIWSSVRTHSTMHVLVRDASTGFERNIVLRTSRSSGACGSFRMHDGVLCFDHGKMGPMTATFRAADNPDLPAGKWRGVAYIRAKGWHDHAVDEAIRLNVEIDQ